VRRLHHPINNPQRMPKNLLGGRKNKILIVILKPFSVVLVGDTYGQGVSGNPQKKDRFKPGFERLLA
jgi:hypothetical protein